MAFWSFNVTSSYTVLFSFSGVSYCTWPYTWGNSNQSFWKEGSLLICASGGATGEWSHTTAPGAFWEICLQWLSKNVAFIDIGRALYYPIVNSFMSHFFLDPMAIASGKFRTLLMLTKAGHRKLIKDILSHTQISPLLFKGAEKKKNSWQRISERFCGKLLCLQKNESFILFFKEGFWYIEIRWYPYVLSI